jgi:hypothetical protein
MAHNSPIVMRMLLAIAGSELAANRLGEESPRSTAPNLHPQNTAISVNYYRKALAAFAGILNDNAEVCRTEMQLNEVFAVFFLMVLYEQKCGQNSDGLMAHIHGVSAFLTVYCRSSGTNMASAWATLPALSQQLLLFIMFVVFSLVIWRIPPSPFNFPPIKMLFLKLDL